MSPCSLGRLVAFAAMTAIAVGACAQPAALAVKPPTPLVTPAEASTPTAAVAAEPSATRYLLVLDFLPYVSEALASDPVGGSPDVALLTPLIGEPTTFGTEVVDTVGSADPDSQTSSRCGVVDSASATRIASVLSPDPATSELRLDARVSRSLLHWDIGEGYASLRIFRQTGSRPTCSDAGTAF
jgi:hypothetical protein